MSTSQTDLTQGKSPWRRLRATAEKGERAFELFAEHTARGILELMKVPVEVHDREFVGRV